MVVRQGFSSEKFLRAGICPAVLFLHGAILDLKVKWLFAEFRGKGTAVSVTIDAASKREAELIAASLPGAPSVSSWRGYGIVRLKLVGREARDLIPILSDCVERHSLGWARLRFGDDEWMFRARNGHGS